MSERRTFEPRDFYNIRNVGDAQVSPDGTRIAFVQSSIDQERDEYRSEIYVVPTAGGAPVRWTSGPHNGEPRWSPDGSRLAFLRAGHTGSAQLWVMPTDGGEAWCVTSIPKGVAGLAWSPDGTRIAFSAALGGDPDDPDALTPAERHRPRVVEHLVYKLDGVGLFDGRHWHLHVVDMTASTADHMPPPLQLTDGDWDDQFPSWSPDGREIAFTSYREPNRHDVLWVIKDVWVVAAEGGEARKVTNSKGPLWSPCWSPDGTTIAYVGHEQEIDSLARTEHLMVVPAQSGEARILTAALDRPVLSRPYGPSNPMVWTPDSQALLCLVVEGGTIPLLRVALDGTTSTIMSGDRMVLGVSQSTDGATLAVTLSSIDTPSDVYVLDAASTERRLTTVNADWLDTIDLAEAERIQYNAADGWQIEGWLLKPPHFDPQKQYPAILEIHGGPHGAYGVNFDPMFHAMAGAGYLVVYLNPRGSAGYGEPFALACVDDWGGKDYEDLMAGVDQVIARGNADPERLGVSGYSYGGFMTAWVVGHTDRFRASVSGAPVSNGYSFWGTSDIGPSFGQYEFGGGTPQENAQHYLERSPVHFLRGCTTPVMLMHHEGDLRCPIGQSEEIFTVLKQQGTPTVMVRYPGGAHRYVTHAPSQRVDAMQRINGWFDRYVLAGSEQKT